MLKPTMISVGIQEIMRVWNDYLLPYLVLDINEYRTIPIHIQYLKGSYGTEIHHQGCRGRRREGMK